LHNVHNQVTSNQNWLILNRPQVAGFDSAADTRYGTKVLEIPKMGHNEEAARALGLQTAKDALGTP
jgi:hypothetical protein